MGGRDPGVEDRPGDVSAGDVEHAIGGVGLDRAQRLGLRGERRSTSQERRGRIISGGSSGKACSSRGTLRESASAESM